MDEDWAARHLARKVLRCSDPDYYDWETHIFFDDAFETDKSGNRVVNDYVKELVKTMKEQGERWYCMKKMNVSYPDKFVTPYGGRLIWTLPGGTQVICHLKDKDKIRHKKRWSQCMYMYYFLGYQIAAKKDVTAQKLESVAKNTFLLALDGDVDFQPDAIIKLVDLMKRNPVKSLQISLRYWHLTCLLSICSMLVHLVEEFILLDLVTCNGTKCLNMPLVIGCKKPLNMSWVVFSVLLDVSQCLEGKP